MLIGRAQTAHIRPSHQSVSRMHAEIIVEPPRGELQHVLEIEPYPIYLLDNSSTGHTFVNTTPSGRGVRRQLQNGDTVCFGVDPVNFSLQWCPTVLSCSSRMDLSEKQHIESLAQKAGVFLTTEWVGSCTHIMMEQFSITPKLLCCIIDGGIPVSRSFLEALANAEPAGQAPDPMQHQPQPPAGADSVYNADLANCIRAPRPRHNMLQNVWIIFATQQAHEALNKALLNAGAKAQFLCTSLESVPSVLAAMTECKTQHGAPEEVWVVPHLEESITSALSGTLLGLGARQHLAVPLPAMVVGILKGNREGAHGGASRIGLVKASKSFLETQQPGASAAVKEAGGIKEETFPHTQDMSVPPTAQRKREGANDDVAQPATKHQRVEAPRPTTLSTGRLEPVSVKMSNSQEALAKPDVPAAGMAQTVSSYDRAKSEAVGFDAAPFTVSSDTGVKQDGSKLKTEAAVPAPATISSCGGPRASQEGSGMPKILSINFDTPMTQPKPEDHKEVIPESIAKAEIKPKEEAPPPRPPASVQSTAAAAHSARIEPVVHPSGVWLPKKIVEERKQEPFILQVQGLGDRDLHSLRATINKGGAMPTLVRAGLPVSSTGGRQGAGDNGAAPRSFKVFRKSLGQQTVDDRVLVPIRPWEPSPGLGLGEAFASHRMESESQLPPV